jgi:death-on-curing protein
MVKYLTPKQLLRIHLLVMERFGEGEHAGIFLPDRFYSATERPRINVFHKELYPDIWQKAAVLVQAIVQEHPFHNGNKRTAFAALDVFLKINGYELTLSNEEGIQLMIRIATDKDLKGKDGLTGITKMIKSSSNGIHTH